MDEEVAYPGWAVAYRVGSMLGSFPPIAIHQYGIPTTSMTASAAPSGPAAMYGVVVAVGVVAVVTVVAVV
eukprot:CAMPEP_0118935384 /NCGR_PEP_ID=MMETSP1169-20130426/15593_1 /TAXON_ID=36882 /ORGANISM="Pyramimonas obovata, Strain CCMP722" /LENGTH=69 /DNA_ID=CAMNT_0006878417 /DNA_START=376 /DNA_END=582 /DNA_ORIENTATION=+